MVLGRFGWFHVLVPTVRKKVLSLQSAWPAFWGDPKQSVFAGEK